MRTEGTRPEECPDCGGYWKGAIEGPWGVCSGCGRTDVDLPGGIDYALWSKVAKPPSRDGFVEVLLGAEDAEECDSPTVHPDSPFGI